MSKWTGVPLTSVTEDEGGKLLRMEEELHRRVISQEKAISALSRAIRRSRAGLKNPQRPVGSFIFLGPTGVGKTELARALANFLFSSDHALIRFDMSEYMEKHSVSKLIGSPPGYVGHEEGGQLTEKIKRNPYSVVLLDEIEKAHPDLFNILLQVFEDGHLTDGLGNRVNFKNTIVIMTSNIGARFIQKKASMGFQTPDSREIQKSVTELVLGEVKRTFNPEFINRVDEIIVFEPLSDDDLRRIALLLIGTLNDHLADRQLRIEVTPEVIDWVIEITCQDRSYGARPLRRAIQRYIEDPLSEELIRGQLRTGVDRDLHGPRHPGLARGRSERGRPAPGGHRLKRHRGHAPPWCVIIKAFVTMTETVRLVWAGLLACVLLSGGPAWAQSAPATPPAPAAEPVEPCGDPERLPPANSPPLVKCVELRAHPVNETMVPLETYQYYIRMPLTRPSQNQWAPYSETAILSDFKGLWGTGFLDNLWVEVIEEPYGNGISAKHVVFHIEERNRVKAVDYAPVGENAKLRIAVSKIDEALKEKNVEVNLDSFVDEATIRKVSGVVRDLYAQEGYTDARVEPTLREVAGGVKLVDLRFNITEGPRVRITEIVFDGNEALTRHRTSPEDEGEQVAVQAAVLDGRHGVPRREVRRRCRGGIRVLQERGLRQRPGRGPAGRDDRHER